jgi:hypothetical protein
LPYIAWICPGSWYIGVIAVQTTGKRNKPLWVWRKLAAASASPARFEEAVAVWGYRVSSSVLEHFALLINSTCAQVSNQIFTMKRLKK